VAGEPAEPLAWLDTFDPLSKMQRSNYAKIRDHNYQIGSPLRARKTCRGEGCSVAITWRYIQLHVGEKLSLMRNSVCERCSRHMDRDKDRSNSRLQLGGSLNIPLTFHSSCNNCYKIQMRETRTSILGKLSDWASKRFHKREDFTSMDSALYTAMTVAVQGFSYGPAVYSSSEQFHLRVMVEKATPACFWTGIPLSLTNGTCPTKKFTTDRIMFGQEGKALSYGDKDQALLDEGWEDGIRWADGAIDKLRGYNAEAEKGRPWTAVWEQRWCRFFNNKSYNGKVDRVQWSKAEWRFFVETCQSRSLVTGQHIEGIDAQIDRIFNSDNYTVWSCILIEQGLNFAKRDMSEFQDSNTFHGHCKLAHGVGILRAAVKEVLDKSRPHRAGKKILEHSEYGTWKALVEETEDRLVAWERRTIKGNLCREFDRLDQKHKDVRRDKSVKTVLDILGFYLYKRCFWGEYALKIDSVNASLVERAFGRIKIINHNAITVVDEPFVFKAVENYFTATDP
ncbi:hypothetical protein BGZ97_008635, partial [Linnemannia gamsii]